MNHFLFLGGTKMKKINKLALPLLSASLLLSGVMIHNPIPTHAAVQQSNYQTQLNLVATHYAKMGRDIEQFQKDVEAANTDEKKVDIYFQYLDYLDATIENESDLANIHTDLIPIKDTLHDMFVTIFNFELDTLDYFEEKIDEVTYNQKFNQMIESMDQLSTDLLQYSNSYKNKYNVTFSNDMLYLLGEEANTVNYTVKKGDTLYKIAKNYGTSVQIIKTMNGLKSDAIKIGQVLKVPVNTTPTPDPKPIPEPAPNTSKHTVKKGETLTTIASQYGMPVSELKKINGLKNDFIKVGQVLKVNEVRKHTVVKGDTVYKIAKKYNVTVDSIRKMNQLKNDNIKIGQVLRIKK